MAARGRRRWPPRSGAANTLVRRPDGSWYADNTDVTGMVAVLTAAGVAPAAAR